MPRTPPGVHGQWPVHESFNGSQCGLTFWHEVFILQRLLDLLVERQTGDADGCGRGGEMVQHIVRLCERVQVVGESDTVAVGDLVHFVLAVAVEGRPLNGLSCRWRVLHVKRGESATDA